MAQAHHKKSLRLMQIRELLRGKEYTSQQLVEAINSHEPEEWVNLRTIQRCLEDLIRLKQVERDETSRPPRYKIAERLSPVEALVTHSALRMLYHHTPGYNPLYFSALNKLAHQLPEPAQTVALQSTGEHKNRRLDEGDALEKVASAWFNRQVIEFDYLKPGGSGIYRKNILEVYFIEVSRANLALYVIGYEQGFHRAIRTYKLGRMRGVQLASKPQAYAIPPSFNPRTYLSNAWGVVGSSGGEPVTVRLRFKPEAAYRIREGGYPNVQQTRQLEDGSILVEIIVGTKENGFPLELLSWVQSWGSRVEVLEPQNLRQRWLEEARAVAQIGEENG